MEKNLLNFVALALLVGGVSLNGSLEAGPPPPPPHLAPKPIDLVNPEAANLLKIAGADKALNAGRIQERSAVTEADAMAGRTLNAGNFGESAAVARADAMDARAAGDPMAPEKGLGKSFRCRRVCHDGGRCQEQCI